MIGKIGDTVIYYGGIGLKSAFDKYVALVNDYEFGLSIVYTGRAAETVL